MPAASPAVLTLAVIVPAFVPLVGVSVSHAALSEALQVSVPPPVLDTPIVFAAGLAAPAAPEKARLVGLSPITGVALPAVTVMVMGTGLVVPPPEMVAVPLYVPAVRPAVEAVCEIVADPPGAIVTVLPELATSQLIGSVQVTVNVLVPVLVMVTPRTWFGPPTVPVYMTEDGETLKLLVAQDGFTKPRSIAKVNAAPPRIVNMVCRVGVVRGLWIVIRVVLSDTNPFPCFLFTEEGPRRGWGVAEQ